MLWVALFLLLPFENEVLGQQLDQLQQKRYCCQVPIAWENVSECCQVVDGVQPIWSHQRRQYIVELNPEQQTDILLAPHEMVRVVGWDKNCLSPDEVEIWLSDGSGLMRKLNVARTSDNRSIVAAPDYPAFTVVRIRRNPQTEGCARFAVYTSRRSVKRGLDSYQCDLINCGQQVEIHDDTDKRPRSYYQVAPFQRIQIGERNGDSRVRFETRLNYNNDTSQHRSYWMKVYVDGAIRKIVTFDTLPERYNRWFVDDCEQLIGRHEFAYLDFLNHENIEVEFSHGCYLRADALGLKLCRPKANRDLVEDLVRVCNVMPDEARAALCVNGQTVLSFDGNDDTDFDPWLHHEQFLNFARDNTMRQGGLNAYMWMRALATHRHGDPDYRDELTVPDLAAKIRGKFTHFRDLLPSSANSVSPRSVRFPIRSIGSPKQPYRQIVLGTQHVEEAAGQLPSAMLFPFSPAFCDGPGALVYQMPENLGPSVLRVVLDKATIRNASKFTIQYDNRRPIEFWVGPTTDIHSKLLKPGYQEAAVLALSNRHFPFDGSTLGGPFASIGRNADSTVAATHELVVPSGVKTVTLRATNGERNTKLVGLQYLTSRYQKLSESEWLYHQREILSGDPVRVEFSRKLLKNQVFDMTGLLDSHLTTFEASITQPTNTLATGLSLSPDAAQIFAEAENRRFENDPTSMIEILSNLSGASSNELKSAALLARADALHQVGESFLGNRELRGLMAFGEDPNLRTQAWQRLMTQADNLPFSHLLAEQYMIFHMLNSKDPRERQKVSMDLARRFVENDRLRMGFFAHPPEPDGTPEVFHLRSLFSMRWWEIMQNFANHIPDPQSSLWTGLKEIRRGNTEAGLSHLELAGAEGSSWIEHWHSGVRINERLKSPDLQQRLDALSEWEQWQSKHPGPRVWEPAPDLVTQCRSAKHIYSSMRDLRSQFFIASHESPGFIEVSGPTTIRIELRPIHSDNADSRFDEWFTVTGNGQLGLVAALGNTPSQQLRIEGVGGVVPGRLAITELKIPEGLHRLELASQDHQFLFRVLQDRPEIKLPALPVLSPSTIAKVITGDYGANMVVEASADDVENDCVRIIDHNCTCKSYLIGRLADPQDCPSIQQAWAWLIARHAGLAKANEIRFVPNDLPFEQTEQDDLNRQAARLAFSLNGREDNHQYRLQMIAMLQDLCNFDPSREDLRGYLNFAKNGTVWKKFESFDERAGVRSFELEHWTPETPEIRIRRSLAGLDQATWVVAGTKEASINVSDERPVHLRLKLRRPGVGFVPMTDTIAVVEIKNQIQRVQVDGEGEKHVDLNLPAGSHRIRVSQETAWANHMLHVEAFEVLEDGREMPFGANVKDNLSRTRTWMVALPEEPIKFTVKGPGLYRVDRRIDGRSKWEILTIPDSTTRTITIYPQDGRSREFVRIFELTVTDRPAKIFSPKQSAPLQPKPISEPVVQAAWLQPIEIGSGLDDFEDLALLPPDSVPASIAEPDFQQLGWQNLGTIAPYKTYRERRALDELRNPAARPGRFTELGLIRYFHDPWANSYERTQMFLRPRLDGSTSFGLNHREDRIYHPAICDPPEPEQGWGPIRTHWRAGLFGQDAGRPQFDGVSSFPWSAFANGGISRRQSINQFWHRTPRLEFFSRYLSEERDGFDSGVLDQDIFTRYKADHRYGLRLSDQWVYQCCIDRRFWMRPMLVTNTDQVIPDNLGVHFGVDQMIGPVQLRLGYRLTGFFADNDRSSAVVQNLFDLDAMLETWQSRYWRTEARFSVRHDVSNGGTSLQFNLRSFFNQGRGYRDMRPDSLLFRPIREERSLRHLMVHPPDAFIP